MSQAQKSLASEMYQENFKLNNNPNSDSAHEVYANVTYESHGEKKYFYKKNKHQGDEEASIMEVAFSNLAELFLRKGLTPKQYIVKDAQTTVTGVASLSMVDVIANNEQNIQFKKLSYNHTINSYDSEPSDKPAIHFLEDFKQGHFAHLMQLNGNNKISFKVDMDSLASCLTASYFLEEDDLHKGNIGYYIKNDNGTSTAAFFKIDHDLMLSDSIMSHSDARVANWMYDEKSFAISVRDLESFPDLKDSGNHYWPTKNPLLVPFGHKKTYQSRSEREAFKNLNQNEAFNNAKWKHFFMQALMPIKSIEASLKKSLDQDDPADQSRINLIKQSVYERQQKLLETLFASQKFRTEFKKNKDQWTNELVTKLDDIDKASFKQEINSLAEKAEKIDKKDTPLHVAIRLNKYQFSESRKAYQKYWNTENSQGDKPLDLVFDSKLTITKTNRSSYQNPSLDGWSIARHLLKYGAQYKNKYRIELESLKKHRFNSPYNSLGKITRYDFKTLESKIKKIDADVYFPLKEKKIISLQIVRQFTKKMEPQELHHLKDALKLRGIPSFNFIKQHRSKLWIVRVFKHLYGQTQTQKKMQALVSEALQNCPKNMPNRRSNSFFSSQNMHDGQSYNNKTNTCSI